MTNLASIVLRSSGIIAFLSLSCLLIKEIYFNKKDNFWSYVVYFLIIIHTTSWIFWNYMLKNNIDIDYQFIDICGLCKGSLEYFYNLGRIAFWVFSFSMFGSFLISKKIKNTYLLNLISFYLVSIHLLFVGSDIKKMPFLFIFIIIQIVIAILVVKKLKNLNLKKVIGMFLDQ